MKIIKFNPKNWSKLKHQFIELEEKCFCEELQMTEEEIKDSMCDNGALVYLAFEGKKLIGNTYGNILQGTDEEWFDGHWDPKDYKHYNKKTLYVTSTAVLPEYRNKGIATRLKIVMHEDLKGHGFKYVIGHAHKGTMINICKKFGGKVIKQFKNWYDSPETHYLYEINLFDMPNILYVPRLKQSNDYNCGFTSLNVLFDSDISYNGEIESLFGINKKIGISHENILNIAKIIFSKSLIGDYDRKLRDIHFIIDNLKRPVLVNYQADGSGHYSVVYGYDRENLYIMDVWEGKEKKVNNKKFLKSWYSKYYGYRWLAFEN